MTSFARIGHALALLTATTAVSHALLLFDSGVTSVGLGDPTQLGRLSRNGVIADWSSTEPFPGVINTGVTYHYHVFDIAIVNTPYVQITIDSGANVFGSAYQTSYDPLNKATHYLGDSGSSGNFFGTDPIAYQVIAAAPGNLEVVVNTTGAGNVGVGDPFRIIVEGWVDTQFDDPTTTPEPATMAIVGIGVIAAIKRRRRA